MKKKMNLFASIKVIFIGIVALQTIIGCNQASSSTDTEETAATNHDAVKPEPEYPNAYTNELQEYINELADHRLIKFSRYQSGSDGSGMMSEEWMDLCSNGRFLAHASSSISINGNTTQDTKNEEGLWEVVGSADAPYLKITSSGGESGKIPIRLEGTKLFLNGERMYHLPKGDANGPQSCN